MSTRTYGDRPHDHVLRYRRASFGVEDTDPVAEKVTGKSPLKNLQQSAKLRRPDACFEFERSIAGGLAAGKKGREPAACGIMSNLGRGGAGLGTLGS
jgi:hypothetical protein